MKVLIVSDIHGGYDNLEKIITKETFDKLIILGDLYYYNFTSNDLQNDKIIKLLQKHKDKLLLIRGNCDHYIDYEKVNLFAHDIITIPINNNRVTLTHGDVYSKGFMPEYHGNIFINGHTHIPVLYKENNIIYANPGSITSPRGCFYKSYMVFDNDKITLKEIDGSIIKELEI